MLELRRPQDRIRVLNAAVAAQTTSMALTRFGGVVTLRPAWIICALDSADALRVGPQPAKTLVSPEETASNVAEMRHMALLQTEAHWVWITPPTVDARGINRIRHLYLEYAPRCSPTSSLQRVSRQA